MKPLAFCIGVGLFLILSLTVLASRQVAEPILSGVVMSRESVPVPGVVVEIVGPSGPHRRLTSEDGRFRFEDIQSGEYTLRASHPAFVDYRHMDQAGETLRLRVEESVEVVVALTRGGVLAGTIRQPIGEAAADVLVTLMAAGEQVRQVWTDHRGKYRFYGLPPKADYVVSAQPSAGVAKLMYPARVLTERDVELSLARLKSGSPPFGSAPASAPEASSISGYLPIFYPGVLDQGSASRLRLQEEQQIEGVDFALALAGTASIHGRLVNVPVANSTGSQVTAISVSNGSSYSTSAIDAAGGFELLNLPPGDYLLRARTWAWPAASQGPDEVRRLELWGRSDVSVSRATDGVQILLQPAPIVSGRVVFVTLDSQPPQLSGARVVLTPVNPVGVTRRQAMVGTDGTFEVSVEPGTYQVTLSLPPALSRSWKLGAIADSHGTVVKEWTVLDTPVSATGFQVRLVKADHRQQDRARLQ